MMLRILLLKKCHLAIIKAVIFIIKDVGVDLFLNNIVRHKIKIVAPKLDLVKENAKMIQLFYQMVV